MSFTNKFVKIYKALLPSPFTIAIVLSFFAFVSALLFGVGKEGENKILTVFSYWENGLWNNNLLVFAMQMMLMLVLGHILAISTPINNFVATVTKKLNTSAKAAAWITFLTMLVAFFNWGLGLIFGAIMARKLAEESVKNNWKLNYPLIAAGGYSGLMVWHGGLSGSSLIKVAEPGHLTILLTSGSMNISEGLSYQETVFSSLNIFTSIMLLVVTPLAMYWMGKASIPEPIVLKDHSSVSDLEKIEGAEKLDYSTGLSKVISILILLYAFYKMFVGDEFVRFFTPNNINLLLLGLALFFHSNFSSFLKALDQAIGGASAILIQFPLYFGIMGILKDSLLIAQFSTYIAHTSSPNSFTFFTFISAGLVNILVPSGGGQWAIQGPLLVQTAYDIGAPLAKNIMAFAYGDQLTNMLQPFWALPLLGITGLKAKQILPYSLFLFAIGLPIFLIALWLF